MLTVGVLTAKRRERQRMSHGWQKKNLEVPPEAGNTAWYLRKMVSRFDRGDGFPRSRCFSRGQITTKVRSLRLRCQDLTALMSVYIFLESTPLTALPGPICYQEICWYEQKEDFFFKLQDCNIFYWPWDKYNLLTSRTGKVNEAKLDVTLE